MNWKLNVKVNWKLNVKVNWKLSVQVHFGGSLGSNKHTVEISGSSFIFHGILEADEAHLIELTFEKYRKEILRSQKVTIDMSDSSGADTAAAVVIYTYCRKMKQRGVVVTTLGFSQDLQNLFSSFERHEHSDPPKRRDIGFRKSFENIGDMVDDLWKTIKGLNTFLFDAVNALYTLLLSPRKIRWQMVFYYMEEAGLKSLPIVATLTWLMGTVLGYQAGYQLKMFAAGSFMPSMIGYSITWEIGPMLSAVLVAGRSGSAFAAEIGTMKVRQEVDALKVMDFSTFDYLVTPKLVALLFVMPLVVLLADCAGIMGGLLAGGIFLDMSADTYLHSISQSLIPLDFLWGMMKGLVYAVIIANTGCYIGMRVRGGAAEVGRATTAAVVYSIFLVILADALLSLLFVHIRPGIVV